MLMSKPSKIYVSSSIIDMRKNIDGLVYVVEKKLKLSPQSDTMFVFHNRHCDKVKILYWDGDGYCLLYKRLEKGKFHFSKHVTSDKYTITNTELDWLLHGLHVDNIRSYEKIKNNKFSTENSVFNMA